MKITLPLAITGFFLSGCTLSLAGDITPPQESEINVPDFQIEVPTTFPDLDAGALIYAESCAPCHGVFGLGDGAQGAQLPFPPAALADPELAGDARPEEWFNMVASGNLNRYMPPFSRNLSSQEIWDVTAYALSLGWDKNRLAEGAQIYAENQHTIEEKSLDLGDLEQFGQWSRLGIGAEISIVLPSLDPVQVEALAVYLQAVSLGYTVPAESQTVSDLENLGTVTGRVINGSDSSSPSDLEIMLRSQLGGALDVIGTAQVNSRGVFLFENLPLEEGRAYFVQVQYDGLLFFSELAIVEGEHTSFDLPVTVYDTTSDTNQLVTEYVHFVFEFPRPGVLRVVEQIGISNLGNLAVMSAAGQPVLHFSLPSGASYLEFSDGALGDRYVGVGDGFGDLRAVMPGEDSYEILFAYELPYKRGANIEFPVDRTTRSVIAFVPEADIQLTGNPFQLIGKQAIEGEVYMAYAGQNFAQGETIRLELSGNHPLGQPGFSADSDFLFGLGALTAALGGGWLWLRSLPARRDSTPNQIIDAIIELDTALESGQLSRPVHKRRRSMLKERLKNALRDQA